MDSIMHIDDNELQNIIAVYNPSDFITFESLHGNVDVRLRPFSVCSSGVFNK